jgi:uncharacterized protein YsxB (DUF464 family)
MSNHTDIKRKPEMNNEEFQKFLKGQNEHLRRKMNSMDSAIAIDSLVEVNKLTDKLIDVLYNYQIPEIEGEFHEESRLLVINRAVSCLHQVVVGWFAEVAANGAVMRKVDAEALQRHWKEVAQQNKELKDQLSVMTLTMRDMAVESIPTQYRAKRFQEPEKKTVRKVVRNNASKKAKRKK